MSRHLEKWPPERVARLRGLVAQGFSGSQVASLLNQTTLGDKVTRAAVVGKCWRLGLSLKSTPARRPGQGKPRAPVTSRPHTGPPMINPNPPRVSRDPIHPGANSVPFDQRGRNQCPMFCEGEEGAKGLVCGNPSAEGETYCKRCASRVYIAQRAEAA